LLKLLAKTLYKSVFCQNALLKLFAKTPSQNAVQKCPLPKIFAKMPYKNVLYKKWLQILDKEILNKIVDIR
jgi:hypothetical protein